MDVWVQGLIPTMFRPSTLHPVSELHSSSVDAPDHSPHGLECPVQGSHMTTGFRRKALHIKEFTPHFLIIRNTT